MASTTALAVSLALLITCMNVGAIMVGGSGFADEMGVDEFGFGIGSDISAATAAMNQNEFTPVAIGSAFAGFTINGVKVLVKAFLLIVIGIPAILQAAGAPAWVWGPLVPVFLMIQGFGAMGLYFSAQV